MKKLIILLSILLSFGAVLANTKPILDLTERVTKSTAKDRIIYRIVENDSIDFFRISSMGDKLLIEGNNNISMAVGLNYYLKYVAKIHICWNNLSQELPDILPLPHETIYKETDLKNRYYLNYCTFSYTMAFWDEERWMKEIDWMALHGINMALSITGIEVVWRNLLNRMGYEEADILKFLPGPSYMAWWQMNNLEGWGGPLPKEWFERQESLQKKIIARMKELGIDPILPGYSGMVPNDFEEHTGISVEKTGLWCGFQRPAFLSPENSEFSRISDLYYQELEKLYGKSNYYSMDPFHEGGDFSNIDLDKTGIELYKAMKKANPYAKWVIQSWQRNPISDMIKNIPGGDLLILDLYSEKIPKWENIGGYGKHDWIYCMLLNFGGNIGMHGRINSLIDGFVRAKNGKYSVTLKGIGATPEGIENNPIMYELLFELPWIEGKVDFDNWLNEYLYSRYGAPADENVKNGWSALINTVYNAPNDYKGEGTVESIICARPQWEPTSVSTWGNSTLFYSPDSTLKAAELISKSYDKYSINKNFVYDFIDIKRQANADEANRLIKGISKLRNDVPNDSIRKLIADFLDLILEQDELLSIIPETTVKAWLEKAEEAAGENVQNRQVYKKNAAMLITVWGDEWASNKGGLHDYSHREWGGLIKDLYYKRWKSFFDSELNGTEEPDYYKIETEWIENQLNN